MTMNRREMLFGTAGVLGGLFQAENPPPLREWDAADWAHLPRVAFHRPPGTVGRETFRIVATDGEDVTRYFACVRALSFAVVADRGFSTARLEFVNRGEWTVSSDMGLVETSRCRHREGFELVDRLEINSLMREYPRDRREVIIVEFDAVWDGELAIPADRPVAEAEWQARVHRDVFHEQELRRREGQS